MKQLSIVSITSIIDSNGSNRWFLIKADGTYYKIRLPINILKNYEKDWNLFRKNEATLKDDIIASILESDERHFPSVFYVEQQFSDLQNAEMSDIEDEKE